MNKKYYDSIAVRDAFFDFMVKVGSIEEADVVKVVRCKDCKYWYDNANTCWGVETCGGFPEIWEYGLDFYCAFGEHKEDEG